jgi:hypothetical protein
MGEGDSGEAWCEAGAHAQVLHAMGFSGHCPGPQPLRDLSVSHSKSGFYGTFVWVRWVLNIQKRWLPARAVMEKLRDEALNLRGPAAYRCGVTLRKRHFRQLSGFPPEFQASAINPSAKISLPPWHSLPDTMIISLRTWAVCTASRRPSLAVTRHTQTTRRRC